MTITLSPEAEAELRVEAERRKLTPEQIAMQAMLAGLRTRRVPQTLGDLKPRRQLPLGMTFAEALGETPWPHDELDLSDNEVKQVLDALS